MATYKNFEDLEVWQLSRDLCKKIHALINDNWFKIDNSLKQQILRSSGSVMDNIAEGFERGSTNEFKTFLAYAKGSCGEVRSQLYRAYDKELISETQFQELKSNAESISVRINRFINYLKSYEHKGNRFSEPEVLYNVDLSFEQSIIDYFNQEKIYLND